MIQPDNSQNAYIHAYGVNLIDCSMLYPGVMLIMLQVISELCDVLCTSVTFKVKLVPAYFTLSQMFSMSPVEHRFTKAGLLTFVSHQFFCEL